MQQGNYSEYVEQGLLDGISDPFEVAAVRSVLGSDSFVERMRRGLLSITENSQITREKCQARQLTGWVNIENLIAEVAEFCDVDADQLVLSRNRDNEGRRIVVYLAKKYCRGRYTLADLSKRLNFQTVGGFSSSYKKIEADLITNKQLSHRVSELEKQLRKCPI